MEQRKIFLGGSYSSDANIRESVAKYARVIEKIIVKCGFIHSKNLLSNEKVHSNKPDAKDVSFGTGEPFFQVGSEAIKEIPQRKIDDLKSLRSFKSIEEFQVCLQAANIAFNELKNSMAAIFELSAVSQGSYMEIGLMLYHFQRPVLCLSHEEIGRSFGTMLTGSKSTLLKTMRYSDENLQRIVEQYLIVDLGYKKLANLSYKMPVELKLKIEQEAKEKGLDSSKVMRNIVESYFYK